MYRPAQFREDRPEALHEVIRRFPLATLITTGSNGLMANLIPFTLTMDGDKGTLGAHLARSSEQVQALREGADVLVQFQGPDAYITPSWYASKREHGKVVPTWNFVLVQARGRPRMMEDPAWILAQINALTNAQESTRTAPWKVSDAPEAFVASQLKALVGIEIPIARIEGKWKVSQNRSAADRQGVEEGLHKERGDEEMAQLVARGGAL